MEAIGPHRNAEVCAEKDVNQRFMVRCHECGTFAHAYELSEAKADLADSPCISDCENCNNLSNSFDGKPAVPLMGSCNSVLHVCPHDGRRWWQSNTYYHLWQQVTSRTEWEVLLRTQAQSPRRCGLGEDLY